MNDLLAVLYISIPIGLFGWLVESHSAKYAERFMKRLRDAGEQRE